MTLCIGAMCHQPSPLEKCIVLCSDYMVANEGVGSDSEYKFQVLSPELICMTAGSISRASELVRIYKGYLKENPLDPTMIEQQLRVPLTEIKERMSRQLIGSCFGMTLEKFDSDGERILGKERYERYLTAFENHDLRVQLIIAGFLAGQPVLYETTTRFDVHEHRNYCLIGSGGYAAEPAMHARTQTANTPLQQTLYNVYEAKRIGEASPFVGQKTRMFVLRPPTEEETQIRAEYITEKGETWLAGLYRRYGPKPMKRWPDMPADSLGTAHFKWPAG